MYGDATEVRTRNLRLEGAMCLTNSTIAPQRHICRCADHLSHHPPVMGSKGIEPYLFRQLLFTGGTSVRAVAQQYFTHPCSTGTMDTYFISLTSRLSNATTYLSFVALCTPSPDIPRLIKVLAVCLIWEFFILAESRGLAPQRFHVPRFSGPVQYACLVDSPFGGATGNRTYCALLFRQMLYLGKQTFCPIYSII